MTDAETPVRRGPRPGSAVWWLSTFANLVIALVLMVVLAAALMVLTRMPIEGTTQPDVHLPTFLVWFAVCLATILRGVVRTSWLELKDERVHVTASGEEVRVNRWSTPQERERYDAFVASSERAVVPRETAAARAPEEPERPDPASGQARVSVPVERVAEPDEAMDRLEMIAWSCLFGWIPLVAVVAVLSALLPGWIPREWVAAPLVLPPIGWVLLETYNVVRHRRLRTSHTRSEMARFHVGSAGFALVIFAVVAFTGLVMREEYIGVMLIAFPLTVLSGWILVRELRHVRARGDEDVSPGG